MKRILTLDEARQELLEEVEGMADCAESVAELMNRLTGAVKATGYADDSGEEFVIVEDL